MGQYCKLYISDYPIAKTSDEINTYILALFQLEDQKNFERRIGPRNGLRFGIGYYEEDEMEVAIEYQNSCKNIRDRLEIMGFTLKKVLDDFKTRKEILIDQITDWLNDKNIKIDSDKKEQWKNEKALLEKSSFNDFLQASKEIIDKKYPYRRDVSLSTKDSTYPIISYLLADSYGLERIPFSFDQRNLLRALLEVIPDEELVIYDITELIEQDEYEDIVDYIYYDTIEMNSNNHEIGEKILILTEGSSDIQILQSAMNVLYPHLTGYYSFMDFGISNASGSASSLVTSIKSFVCARIKIKIIALFDNDAAAESAMKGLQKVTIPNNIKILQYPNIKIAEDYPTLGPSGNSNMNINGLACSIEMYLGQDVLKNKNGFISIQWKGLVDSALGKYQGEILEKSKVSDNFKTKVEICLKDRSKIKDYDWTEMDQLLQTMFNAFNSDEQDE